eukprot:1141336-Pelagomonas_calceolata.AAC.4
MQFKVISVVHAYRIQQLSAQRSLQGHTCMNSWLVSGSGISSCSSPTLMCVTYSVKKEKENNVGSESTHRITVGKEDTWGSVKDSQSSCPLCALRQCSGAPAHRHPTQSVFCIFDGTWILTQPHFSIPLSKTSDIPVLRHHHLECHVHEVDRGQNARARNGDTP